MKKYMTPEDLILALIRHGYILSASERRLEAFFTNESIMLGESPNITIHTITLHGEEEVQITIASSHSRVVVVTEVTSSAPYGIPLPYVGSTTVVLRKEIDTIREAIASLEEAIEIAAIRASHEVANAISERQDRQKMRLEETLRILDQEEEANTGLPF